LAYYEIQLAAILLAIAEILGIAEELVWHLRGCKNSKNIVKSKNKKN
jgi:hypothetical protein